ncbi:hypothetical protein PTSG_00031 [Salpingoeca rosetta]|uniref:ELMO domain-containing protein n=1 Tax=Salpingoeca rosetta (strain ATCC 50818 / BSB-021) TaxID=946362 RepID=F2TVB9_SALR5|nr:uncharacterized protein PTSG_00031 [Salpingoeca rosetta]EGD72015.1 hypothetical protein PTSG_00031 [Salpingoeca rosetta]|eukprot:XP_004998587.1 hypothetical protein PTSG_00031 [Salpingoeca rosetta]
MLPLRLQDVDRSQEATDALTTLKALAEIPIGFQGRTDPTTDFRGMGELALRCLTRVVLNHAEVHERCLREEGDRFFYFFAIAGINLCQSLYRMLNWHNELVNHLYKGVDTSSEDAVVNVSAAVFYITEIQRYLEDGGPPALVIMQFESIRNNAYVCLDLPVLSRAVALVFHSEQARRESVQVVIHKPPTARGVRYAMTTLSIKPSTPVRAVKELIVQQLPDLMSANLTYCVDGKEIADSDAIAPEGAFARHPHSNSVFLHFRYEDPTLEEVVQALRKERDFIIPLDQVKIKGK